MLIPISVLLTGNSHFLLVKPEHLSHLILFYHMLYLDVSISSFRILINQNYFLVFNLANYRLTNTCLHTCMHPFVEDFSLLVCALEMLAAYFFVNEFI
jgi:hypothetical protein